MDIERQLRASLAARDAPPDFESAVMARLQAPRPQPARLRRAGAWRVPAAMAATVLVAAAGLHWHLQQQRAAETREQLVLALAITSHELNEVRERLARQDPTPDQENGT